MQNTIKTKTSNLYTILIWGSLWGIFEATAGYLLHLIPFKIGSYVWLPAAYFFMDKVFRLTGTKRAVVWAALVSAGIKLLNLLTPIRADYVINPAVSIMIESFSMVAVLALFESRNTERNPQMAPCHIALFNALWRIGYIGYLGLLAPDWIREASVLANASSLKSFLAIDWLLSTAVIVAISLALRLVLRRTPRHLPSPRPHVAIGLFAMSVLLQFVF